MKKNENRLELLNVFDDSNSFKRMLYEVQLIFEENWTRHRPALGLIAHQIYLSHNDWSTTSVQSHQQFVGILDFFSLNEVKQLLSRHHFPSTRWRWWTTQASRVDIHQNIHLQTRSPLELFPLTIPHPKSSAYLEIKMKSQINVNSIWF